MPGAARFRRSALLGSIVALGLYLGVLVGPGATLLRDNGLLGSFYDVQGQALLDGRLDVDPERVTFEGFRMNGETHIYFGLFPSVLRLPVLAVTDGLDGRLTQLSMLLSFVVLMTATAQLHWRLRSLVRPEAQWSRAEGVGVFLAQVAVGAGAVPLYLASRAVVYHEAESWGAALAVAGLGAAVGVVARPSQARIAWAGLLATLALNTRFSVGLAPVLALALLALGAAASAFAARRPLAPATALASFGPRTEHLAAGRAALSLACAVLVALALHGFVNSARFGMPFGIPIDKQVQSEIEPNRRAALAANDGTIFGPQFVPTALFQTLRPDAVGTVRAFPFLGLPSEPAEVIGDVRFDTIEPSLSAITSMPALFLLTLVGIWASVSRRDMRPVVGMLVAAGAAFALTLTIAFVTTRYLADLMPLVVLGGLIGLQTLLERERIRGPLLVTTAALILAGIATNGGAGLVTQRLLYHASEPERADFVRFQADVDDLLGRSSVGVEAGRELPERATGSPGDLFVLDGCAGLYVEGLQNDWLPVERTSRAGVHRLRAGFRAAPARPSEALITLGRGPERVAVTSSTRSEGTVFSVLVGSRAVDSSGPVRTSATGLTDVRISADRFSGGGVFVGVDVAGKRVVTALTPDVRRARATVGRDPAGLPSFSGPVRRVGFAPTACRAVTNAS